MSINFRTLEIKFATFKPLPETIDEAPMPDGILYTVSRRGRVERSPWHELTAYERKSIRLSQERADYNVMFSIYE
jgi:hypothetical protein